MQYLVTTNKDRVPTKAQVFVVGRTPVGWTPKIGDFCWDRHRSGAVTIQIDEMPLIEASIESATLLELFDQAQTKQYILTARADPDTCAAAAWLQLTQKQQQANRDKLRAIAMDGDRLYDHPELVPLTNFSLAAVDAMRQEELKLTGKMGELLGATAFWFGGLVHLKNRDIEGKVVNIRVGDRSVEVDCGFAGTHFSNYWDITYPRDRTLWSDYQRECYESLAFRVNAEWLIAACRGDRPWPGEEGEAKAYLEQVQSDTCSGLQS